MKKSLLYTRSLEAADTILKRLPMLEAPEAAIVLGSGLGLLADRLADPVELPYGEIPHFPETTVAGHAGKLRIGKLNGVSVAVLQGRFHYYEGHPLSVVTFPVRVLQRLGVKTLILTASTGGIRDDLEPGRLVCLSDHLNLLGENPLRGDNDDRLGTRFPDMTEVYSKRLRSLAMEESQRLGIPLAQGVYACVPGPSYETPAEVCMLRVLGADVVGMSTVPEAIVARHSGLEVLAFAAVANWAAGITDQPLSHAEVLQAGEAVAGSLADLIEAVVGKFNI